MSEYMSDGPVPGDAPVTVPEITNKILGQLAAGELAPAQRTAEEALAKGASTDGLDATAAKRWDMTRELLAVAWEIPMPLTKALAKGIDGNNPATAADDCKAFAKSNADGAATADKVLSAKAPGLYQYIPGALKAAAAPKPVTAAPRMPAYYDYTPPPVYTSSSGSGSWRIFSAIGVITIAFIRCAIVSSSHNDDYSYHPSYSYDNPSFDYNDDKMQELQKALDDIQKDKDLYGIGSGTDYGYGADDTKPTPAGPPEAPEFVADEDSEDMYSEIATSLSALYRVDMTSDKQQSYLEKLDDAVVNRDCGKMKTYIALLEKTKPGSDVLYPDLAKDHMKAIHKRVDVVCKKKAAVKKPAAPKPPADDSASGDGL